MKRKLRLGMIGGGQGAFIGAVHRLAARIDDKYEFVAGCLSSTPAKAEESAKEIGLDLSRSYPDNFCLNLDRFLLQTLQLLQVLKISNQQQIHIYHQYVLPSDVLLL